MLSHRALCLPTLVVTSLLQPQAPALGVVQSSVSHSVGVCTMHVQTHTHHAVSCRALSCPSQELRDAHCQTSVCHQITKIGPLAQSRVPPTPKARASPASGLFHVEREKQGLVLPGKTSLGVKGSQVLRDLDRQGCIEDLLCGAHRAELPAVLTEKFALLRSHLLDACGHLGGLEAPTSHFHLVQRQTCRQRTHLGSPPRGWPRKGTQAGEASLRGRLPSI